MTIGVTGALAASGALTSDTAETTGGLIDVYVVSPNARCVPDGENTAPNGYWTNVQGTSTVQVLTATTRTSDPSTADAVTIAPMPLPQLRANRLVADQSLAEQFACPAIVTVRSLAGVVTDVTVTGPDPVPAAISVEFGDQIL